MLESMITFDDIYEKPYKIFIWAFAICSVAVFVSTQVAGSVSSIGFGYFVVLFTIIPSVYFFTELIKKEEAIEEKMIKKYRNGSFFSRHERDLLIILLYFAGITLSFAIWSFLTPDSFSIQIDKINQIKGVSGQITEFTGHAANFETFERIFVNNMQVFVISFIFSLLFGAGAVFIIVWNASVLGVYIGQLSKYIWHIPIVSLSFLPHGVFEIGGYICAGLAGGIVSASILRKNNKDVIKIVIFDSIKLIFVGVMAIMLGAGIEAYL